MKTMVSLFEIFEQTCKKNLCRHAISFKKDNDYTSITYQYLYTQSLLFGNLLKRCGIKPNDFAAIILENSPLWPITYFGIMSIGATAIPLPIQSDTLELKALIDQSEPKIIVTSSELRQKFIAAFSALPVPIIISAYLEENQNKDNSLISSLSENFSKERSLSNGIASIVYTSGTTAVPKGVILTHQNFLANIESLKQLNLIRPADCLICILPLHHTYPFMVTLLFPLLYGIKITFPPHLEFEEIISCIKKNRVTILIAVPRIFTLLVKNVHNRLIALNFMEQFFLNLIFQLNFILRKININLSKWVFKDLHKQFGSNFRFMASGGAKLNVDVAFNLFKWGFTILEGYGLTETSPVVTFNTPNTFKIGSAGKPIPGVKIKIDSPDNNGIGEILVKGKNVTSGYYKDSALSRQMIKNDWFYTRDSGFIDEEGFLFITGRCDEAIILSTGKKINPEELESYYGKNVIINELCIFLPAASQIGQPESIQNEDLLTAVILPNFEYLKAQGISQIKDKIRLAVENLSRDLPVYKRIKKYIIINESLPKTMLGKLKRFEIKNKYSAQALKYEAETKEKAIPIVDVDESKLSIEDRAILSLPLCQEVIKHLSERIAKTVNLNDHLELDLGLDSLERINLFFELKRLSGLELDEKTFTNAFTVREVLSRIKEHLNGQMQIEPPAKQVFQSKNEETLNWTKFFKAPVEKELTKQVSVSQTLLAKAVNCFFAVVLRAISHCFPILIVKTPEKLPQNGPLIFCPNHCSYFDAPLVAASLNLPLLLNTYFLGYSAYLDNPIIKWGKKLFRLISLDPTSKLTDTLKICRLVLKKSKVLCIFPEGARSPDGQVKEFKRGIGILVKELNTPVIPVFIGGTYKLWPPHKKFPRTGKVMIIFGKMLTGNDLTLNYKKDSDIYQHIADNLRNEVLKLRDLL